MKKLILALLAFFCLNIIYSCSNKNKTVFIDGYQIPILQTENMEELICIVANSIIADSKIDVKDIELQNLKDYWLVSVKKDYPIKSFLIDINNCSIRKIELYSNNKLVAIDFDDKMLTNIQLKTYFNLKEVIQDSSIARKIGELYFLKKLSQFELHNVKIVDKNEYWEISASSINGYVHVGQPHIILIRKYDCSFGMSTDWE